jgi:GAF domain-containing protein
VGEIGRQIASILDLDELLRQMVDLLEGAFGYRYVYILLLDEDSNELVARAGAGPGRVLEGTRIPIGAGSINACVARTGKPLLANDVSREPMYLLLEEIADTRSELTVPIKVKGQVIGTLDVQSSELNAFDESDLATLQTLADQAAIAIETARLFAETAGRSNDLALLLDTSTAISSTLNLDQILETVAQQITTSLVATFCRISLLDKVGEDLVIRAVSPIRDRGMENGLGRRCPLAMAPLHRQVIETGKPVVLRLDEPESALSDEESKMTLSERVKSAALIPLIVGGRVLGIISLGEERSWERSPFSPEKVGLCQSIARQAAVAIENARLYEETQQRLQELAILMESGAMAVSSLNLKELLGKAAELMTLSIGVEACGISSWKKGEGVVRTLAEYSSAIQVVRGGATYRLDDYPATAQLLHSGQPFQVRVDDPTADERERAFLEAWPMKSLLALPIAGENGVVGLMELYDGQRTRTFGPEEIARGQAWAEQMAPFVERTPALKGEGEKEPSRALRQLMVQVMHDLDLAWCVISHWDRTGEQVVTVAECGDVIWPREAGASYPVADYPATAHVLHQRQPIVVRLDDPLADERERALFEEEGWGAMLSLPMMVRDEVIGLVELFDRQPRSFTTAEIELSQTLANQAAIALENARSQEELQRSFERLQRTLEGTVKALASAIEMRDRYTAGHQRRVAQLACAIANEMGLPEEQIEGLRMAGLIHDLGKITVPAEILSKPGRLDDIEYGLIKAHPQIGHDVLKTIDFPWPVAQIVLEHHERMDGSGYPQGLKGEEILLEARILAVADVVEAMASFRPYRPALGVDKSLEEISQNRDILYDPGVVDACLKLFTENRFEFEQSKEVDE